MIQIIAFATLLVSVAGSTAADTATGVSATPSFDIANDQFMKDGKPYQIKASIRPFNEFIFIL